MANVRSGHLVIGVGLAVMGYAVLIIALAEQAERGITSSTAAAAHPSPMPAAAPIPEPASVAPSTPPPAASKAAGADEASDAPEHLFKFSPGGAVMAREEVQRLLAFGKLVARRPGMKVAIEGFGDLPGSEPLMTGIGKHRAKVGQTLLVKAGVSDDRVSVMFADMGSDPRLARTIRITTTPPFDGEKP
ncbi:MAG TPA: hypothetical protein VF881_04820 [Polyangiaceae bacterium]